MNMSFACGPVLSTLHILVCPVYFSQPNEDRLFYGWGSEVVAWIIQLRVWVRLVLEYKSWLLIHFVDFWGGGISSETWFLKGKFFMDLYIFKSNFPPLTAWIQMLSSLLGGPRHPLHSIKCRHSVCKNTLFNFLVYMLLVYGDVIIQVQSSLTNIKSGRFPRHVERVYNLIKRFI